MPDSAKIRKKLFWLVVKQKPSCKKLSSIIAQKQK